MPTGTKRGYVLILSSATLVAFIAAALILWAAGVFAGPVGFSGWVAIIALLGLGWICGGTLVSLLFLGARTEDNARLGEARAWQRARPPGTGRPQADGRL